MHIKYRKILAAVALLFTLTGCAGAETATIDTANYGENPFAKMTGPVHRLLVEDIGTGTYVVVAEGYAFTAGHVVELIQYMDDAEEWEIVHADYQNDVVLVKDPSFHCPCAPLADQLPVLYSKVWSVSHPRGTELDIVVDGRYQGMEGTRQIYTVNSVNGSSGGGIFNTNGELIGIISAVPSTTTDVGAASPVGPPLITNLKAKMPITYITLAVPLAVLKVLAEEIE